MTEIDKINRLISIDCALYQLYEQISTIEIQGKNERLEEKLSHVWLIRKVEQEILKDMNIDKDNFFTFIRFLNVDNTLEIMNGFIETFEKKYVFYDILADDVLYAYQNPYEKIKQKKEKRFDLSYFHENTINHPVLRRILFLILNDYYSNPKNKYLLFEYNIIQCLDFLTIEPHTGRPIYGRQNVIATLYQHTYAEHAFLYLQYVKDVLKNEKNKFLQDTYYELKRKISFINPIVENYLLDTDYLYSDKRILFDQGFTKSTQAIYNTLKRYIDYLSVKNSIQTFLDFTDKTFDLKDDEVLLCTLYIQSYLKKLSDVEKAIFERDIESTFSHEQENVKQFLLKNFKQ